jgi:ERF superfamily
VEIERQSTELKELYTALSMAQGELEDVFKDSPLTHLKSTYANFQSCVNTARPTLKKYGLSVVQLIEDAGDHQVLVTKLCHKGGGCEVSRCRIITEKPDLKSFGAAITYLKRYCFSAILCQATTDEDPDSISEREWQEQQRHAQAQQKRAVSTAPITSEQCDLLQMELSGYPELTKEVMEKMKISSLMEIRQDQLTATIKRIREIKSAGGNKIQ